MNVRPVLCLSLWHAREKIYQKKDTQRWYIAAYMPFWEKFAQAFVLKRKEKEEKVELPGTLCVCAYHQDWDCVWGCKTGKNKDGSDYCCVKNGKRWCGKEQGNYSTNSKEGCAREMTNDEQKNSLNKRPGAGVPENETKKQFHIRPFIGVECVCVCWSTLSSTIVKTVFSVQGQWERRLLVQKSARKRTWRMRLCGWTKTARKEKAEGDKTRM